ncbi:type II toxin-antitoxin system YoeB family toxin [Salinifilum ghardaiensis]
MVRGENAWEDYVRWQTRGRGVLERINALIERNGNEGFGEPEPLEHGFQGYWYRRSDEAGPSRGPGVADRGGDVVTGYGEGRSICAGTGQRGER